MEEVDQLEAGIPYVFIPEESEIHVYYLSSSAVDDAGHYNGLYGTFTDIQDGAADDPNNVLEGNYMISQNKFRKCGENCSLSADRAYIKMNEVPVKGAANAPKPVAGRRHAVIGGDVPQQTPTGIEPQTEGTMLDTGIYDILGRRWNEAENLPAGAYIINGKKVMIVR